MECDGNSWAGLIFSGVVMLSIIGVIVAVTYRIIKDFVKED